MLYRPYDGKLRPKPWELFEAGRSYWRDIQHFRTGLAASRNFRRTSYIIEWYKEMEDTAKRTLQRDLAAIDAGSDVEVDRDLHGDNDNASGV